MEKTVVVVTENLEQHSKYKKFIKSRKTFKAHDEDNVCQIGDKVKIEETRPLSKDKRWRVVEVLSH